MNKIASFFFLPFSDTWFLIEYQKNELYTAFTKHLVFSVKPSIYAHISMGYNTLIALLIRDRA